jgi:hypothetical protein
MLSIFLPLLASFVDLAAAAAPTELLVDFQPAPAVGVSASPSFGWAVPPCAQAGAEQSAYAIAVSLGGKPVWASGKRASNASVAVNYGGPALQGGRAYSWTVQSWSGACASEASAPAEFITALTAFAPAATWVGAGKPESTFNLVRRVVRAPACNGCKVLGFITAQNSDPTMLLNYKLYVGGVLASAGPGRGEARVAGGDGLFRSAPYVTVDLTEHFAAAGGPTLLALQTMNFGGFDPGCYGQRGLPKVPECDGPVQIANGPSVLLQVDVYPSGGGEPTRWVTGEAGWRAMDADAWFRPGDAPDNKTVSTSGSFETSCILRVLILVDVLHV